MSLSQNVRFYGVPQSDPVFENPKGASIARLLAKSLKDDGWKVANLENWWDVGWSLKCTKSDSEIEIALSCIDVNQWMLQIAPLYVPGIVGGLLSRPPSANAMNVFDLACLVHGALEKNGFQRFRWRWDGYPDDANSTEAPTVLNGRV